MAEDITLTVLEAEQNACSIEIKMEYLSQDYACKSNTINIMNDMIALQTMFSTVDGNLMECFVKITKKQNCDELTKSKTMLLSSREIIDDAQNEHNQLVEDDKWYQIATVKRNNNSGNKLIVKIKSITAPLQMSYEAVQEDSQCTDFELRGVDGSLRIHKAVAATCSPYFKSLLTDKWFETDADIVKVPDTSLTTLQYLKDYMYLGKIAESGDLKQLLRLSSMYKMEDLELRCVHLLMNNATTEVACELMHFAVTHNITALLYEIIRNVERGHFDYDEMQALYDQTD